MNLIMAIIAAIVLLLIMFLVSTLMHENWYKQNKGVWKQKKIVDKKCLYCGSLSLVPLIFTPYGGGFKIIPKKPRFFSTSDLISIASGYTCLDCGFIELFTNVERVKAIVGEKESVK